MDFALSEQQQFLQSTIIEFLEVNAPLATVRELAASDRTVDPGIKNGLAALGVPGVLIPEEFGGVGLSPLDAALIAEPLGYGGYPLSFCRFGGDGRASVVTC